MLDIRVNNKKMISERDSKEGSRQQKNILDDKTGIVLILPLMSNYGISSPFACQHAKRASQEIVNFTLAKTVRMYFALQHNSTRFINSAFQEEIDVFYCAKPG